MYDNLNYLTFLKYLKNEQSRQVTRIKKLTSFFFIIKLFYCLLQYNDLMIKIIGS